MPNVSLTRLYVLRAFYLVIAVGLGLQEWPGIIHHGDIGLVRGEVRSLFGAFSALALLGVRYPLQMLPLLFFEFLWKTIFVVAMAWPLWRANRLDADTADAVKGCLMGVVLVPLVVPWSYIFANYVKRPGDRWRVEKAA